MCNSFYPHQNNTQSKNQSIVTLCGKESSPYSYPERESKRLAKRAENLQRDSLMATKLVHPPIPASQVCPPIATTKNMMKFHPTQRYHRFLRYGESPWGLWSHSCIRAAERISELASANEVITEDAAATQGDQYRSVTQIKEDLLAQLEGINRGIFGTPSEKKDEIARLVGILESQNPTPEPTASLETVSGAWKLLYSTITILGSKRTKLGLRDFITLGNFMQSINVVESKAVNIIEFSAKGLNLLNGRLKIEASFKIASKTRVDISYCKSEITPAQLMNVFRKNYNLLLSIFNPEGWLEITYVDDSLRIGRDDHGNIFILERLDNDA